MAEAAENQTVEPAAGGRYQAVVTGQSPTRFVVAVGLREEFFTPTERSVDRPTSFPGIAEPLNQWYTTPADGSAPAETDQDGVDVDVDQITDALDELDENGLPIEAEGADAGADAEGTAEIVAEDEATEEAVGDTGDDDSGGGSTWVAPTLGLLAIVGGGAWYVGRRRQTAS